MRTRVGRSTSCSARRRPSSPRGPGENGHRVQRFPPAGPAMTSYQAGSSVLLDAVRRVCHDVLAVAPPEIKPVVQDVLSTLAEPLRLAVAGRVKAGKSTLVNALVGRLVAPTRAGECTK